MVVLEAQKEDQLTGLRERPQLQQLLQWDSGDIPIHEGRADQRAVDRRLNRSRSEIDAPIS
jgi:hypothetical protein